MSEPAEKHEIVPTDASVTPEILGTAEIQNVDCAQAESPAVTHVVIKRRDSAAWAVASVFIVGIIAVSYVIYSVVYSLPSDAIRTGGDVAKTVAQEASTIPERLAAAMKPNVNVSTVMSSAIENVKHDGKLVVMTADVDVEINKVSEKVLWETLRLGDTTVRLRVRDNKIQYFIPMESVSPDNVKYDVETNAVVITVPPPRIDDTMVEVQSNPEFMEAQTDVGWGRLPWFSGEALMDDAKRELRDAVLREGSNPLLQEKAGKEGEEAVRALFDGLRPHLRDGVAIQVQFS